MKHFVVAVMMLAADTAPDFPEYKGRPMDSIERSTRDLVASSWDGYSVQTRQCALDTMRKRRITHTYHNLLTALMACESTHRE